MGLDAREGLDVTGTPSLSAPPALPVISPAPRDVWDRLVASDPNSLPSQTGRWLDAVCSVSGLEDASRLYQARDGRLLVLPLVRRKGAWESWALRLHLDRLGEARRRCLLLRGQAVARRRGSISFGPHLR